MLKNVCGVATFTATVQNKADDDVTHFPIVSLARPTISIVSALSERLPLRRIHVN